MSAYADQSNLHHSPPKKTHTHTYYYICINPQRRSHTYWLGAGMKRWTARLRPGTGGGTLPPWLRRARGSEPKLLAQTEPRLRDGAAMPSDFLFFFSRRGRLVENENEPTTASIRWVRLDSCLLVVCCWPCNLRHRFQLFV